MQFEDRQVNKLQIHSVSRNYLETTGRKMLKGRFFDGADFDQYRQVAIVDEKLAFALFKGQNPLQQAVFFSNLRFVIVGVMQSRLGESNPNLRGTLWMTENFANALEGDAHYSETQVSLRQLEDITTLTTQVEQILAQRYPQMSVYVEDNVGDLLREKETQEIVIERTKEIGLRRALGATQLEVMLQFILEAVLLSAVGGIMAIATVHGARCQLS